MYTPSQGTYSALAKEYSLIPVYREVIADLETPISTFMKLCQEEPGAFLLESVEGGERVARYSFAGCRPIMVLASRDGVTRITEGEAASEHRSVTQMAGGNGETRVLHGDPLAHLRAVLAEYRPWYPKDLPRFFGGAVGYLSYDAVRHWERLPDRNPDTLQLPDALFVVPELVVVFDHLKRKMLLIANSLPGKEPEVAYRRAVSLLDRAVARLRGPLPVPPGLGLLRPKPLSVSSNRTREDYEAAVEKAKEYIRAGDIFQVVLSQRLETAIRARPLDIYRVLRTVNPSPYMFYLTFGELKLIGTSPELMVRVEDGIARVRPLAGTRRRGADEAEGRRLEEELLADEKERAEHVMLVDLGRNDLGRVCEYGSVRVTEMMQIERYSHVMHIVSDVEGRLAPGRDCFDALASCFPAGTLSGAPKVRAMEIIDDLEPTRRGPYGGTVGYFGFSGSMDTCITIRTIIVKGEKAYIQCGAGIVADSDPAREWEETMHKAGALLRTLEVAEEGMLL
jgi:anthranilate synthase component I